MIKLKAFLLSLVLVIATLALLNVTYVKKIDDYYKVKDNSIRYSTSYEKYRKQRYSDKQYYCQYTGFIGFFGVGCDYK